MIACVADGARRQERAAEAAGPRRVGLSRLNHDTNDR